MANDLQLLSIGDASLDTFLAPSETETVCQLDTKKCLICFNYGDKIPVESLDFSLGGNAANNAVGTSRLGIKTGIVLTVGDDSIGHEITTNLTKEQVATSLVSVEPHTSSNSSIIIRYQGERTIFTYHAPRVYTFPPTLPPVNWVYLTSMGESFRPFYDHVMDWISKNPNTKLIFNPGTWQLKSGTNDIKDVLNLTSILFVNREEAEKLTAIPKSVNNQKDLLLGLMKLGVQTPVITDGQNGAFAASANKFFRLGVLNIPVIERTGAGDAFGSGCISALIKGKTLEEALLWGTVNSASVIGYIGAQKGLLKTDEIGTWLERAESCNVKVEEI